MCLDALLDEDLIPLCELVADGIGGGYDTGFGAVVDVLLIPRWKHHAGHISLVIPGIDVQMRPRANQAVLEMLRRISLRFIQEIRCPSAGS